VLSDIQTELIKQIKRFCSDQIEPIIRLDEQQRKFRKEIFQKLGQLGVTGIETSEEFGGAGLGLIDQCLVIEELAKYSASYAVTVSVSSMVQGIIQNFGSLEQKKKYLPPLASGQEIGAFALSETSSGSDAASLKAQAKKVEGGYLLNGNKMWITSAGVASTYVVMARTGGAGSKGISAFIVHEGAAGLSFGKNEDKMGWKSSPTREMILKDVFISQENLLGAEGDGLLVAKKGLYKGRVTIGALSLGLAQRALEESLRYSLIRQQFEQSIYEFQGIQFMLADMATEVEASRALIYKAAQLFDLNTPQIMLSSMAKLKATETAMKVTTDAVQILGGVGYTEEFPVERLMRDAKVCQIVEGTNQIQKSLIASELKKNLH
jgi:butyryl-CoA dehydrogenase